MKAKVQADLLRNEIDQRLLKEASEGYIPVRVDFPPGVTGQGCLICGAMVSIYRVGMIGARDAQAKSFVWTVAGTCVPCGDSDEKMRSLVERVMRLPLPGNG